MCLLIKCSRLFFMRSLAIILSVALYTYTFNTITWVFFWHTKFIVSLQLLCKTAEIVFIKWWKNSACCFQYEWLHQSPNVTSLELLSSKYNQSSLEKIQHSRTVSLEPLQKVHKQFEYCLYLCWQHNGKPFGTIHWYG